MSFWAEFKRRNVFRVGAVYLATAWVLSQAGSLVAQAFAAPAWPCGCCSRCSQSASPWRSP